MEPKKMITIEQVAGFIAWQQEKPDSRSVKIEIEKSKGMRMVQFDDGHCYPDFNVTVYDKKIGEVQFVNDPAEIDLIGERKKRLQNDIAKLQALEVLESSEKEGTP